MGKNFKEFWKRQIAKALAVAMTISTLCSAGVPVVHAVEEPEYTKVDGRIISETALELIEAGGSWSDSFEFTKDVLETIFGTSIATFEDGTTVDLAKDVNNYTAEEDAPISLLAANITNDYSVPLVIRGNGKELEFKMKVYHSAVDSADKFINNYVPASVNGVSYSEMVANYMQREGSLVNRDGMLSIGLGAYDSSAALDARFGRALNNINGVNATTHAVSESTLFVGKTYSLWKQGANFEISNLLYIGANEYLANDHTPVIAFVPVKNVERGVEVIVKDAATKNVVPATVSYVTTSGVEISANQDTSEKVTATATLPNGYKWHAVEDGVVEFGYWDTTATIYVDQVDYNITLSVVDKYDSAVLLTGAQLSLEQKVDGNWTNIGTLTNWQLSESQIAAMRNAANTANYQFRIVNSTAQPGYVVDDSVVDIDARIGKTITKQYQEVAKYSVIVSNIADDNTGMEGAEYFIGYNGFNETLTLDANGHASSSVFMDNGAETLSISRPNSVDGYIRDNATLNRTYQLSDISYDAATGTFALYINDHDTLYIPPDYNHHINIHVADEKDSDVAGVLLGLYTDDTCKNPAKTEVGASITEAELTTNDAGNIYLPEVPAGTYYVKLVRSTTGYSDTLFNPTSLNNVEIFTVVVEDNDNDTVLDIGIKRQVGDITLTVTDENGDPVVGAKYRLNTKNIVPSDYAGTTVPNKTLVGEYTTDNNGIIHITKMNSGAFNKYDLVNGIYQLVFISAPYGYTQPQNHYLDVDLSWVEHEDVVYAAFTDTIENASYPTDLTVVDKYNTSISLPNAVLSLQQKVDDEWQDVGNLVNWDLTSDMRDILRDAANTENYDFRIVNSAAHPGYVVDSSIVTIDARMDYTRTKEFQEVAKYIVHITNIADDGTPMAGATYTLTYGDFSATLTLDENGCASSEIFLDSGVDTFTLTRDTEVSGYVPEAANQSRVINLSDMVYNANDDAFAYTVTDKDALYIPPDYNHHINIHVENEVAASVGNVQLGIYTDAACQTPAKTETDADITTTELTTNNSGDINLPEVPAGTYYVKLVRSTNGYSDVLFDPANGNNTTVFTVVVVDDDNTASLNVGIRRQTGDITLTVTDENGAPVVGAVYELKDNDTVLNEYITDNDGVIHIAGLDNGLYELAFVSAPYGYTTPTHATLSCDLSWVEHEEVVYVAHTDNIGNVAYTTNFTVIDKYDTTKTLPGAILTLQQKVDGSWEDIGNLDNWQLTPALVDFMRAAANTANYEFRIINSVAHAGYVADDSNVTINARVDNNVTKEFQEIAKYVVHISNVASDGTPMAGAKYTLTYGDFVEEIILDANGQGSTSVFFDSGIETLTLTRDTTVGDYIPQPENLSRVLGLNDLVYNAGDDAFAYTFSDEDAEPDYNHHINISVIDDVDAFVGGVTVGIYTDEECTNPATLEDGSAIPAAALVADNAGVVHLPEVNAGTYYIKLVGTATGYTKTTFDPANDAPTTIFTVTVEDNDVPSTLTMGVKRQRGTITMVVEDTNHQPIPGALFEITGIANPADYKNSALPNPIVLGQFTTDANGQIYITNMTNDDALVNGIYTAKLLGVPEGYKPAAKTEFIFDLSWNEDVDVVSARDILVLSDYFVYTFDVEVIDETMSEDTLYTRYTHADDTTFKDAFNDTLLPHVAYLTKGKDIVLTVTASSDLSVLVNGAMQTIPAGTIVLELPLNGDTTTSINHIYYTPAVGEPVSVEIPEGIYKFTLNEPGRGYEFKDPYYEISTYDMGAQRHGLITMRQWLQFADTTINKTDANSNAPIADITFALINVDVLSVHGLDITDATLTNKDVTEFLQENDIAPRFVSTTNDDGAIEFGLVPYGTYWLIEMYDAVSADYEMTNPKLVTINDKTAIVEDITNISRLTYIQILNSDAETNTALPNAQFELYNDDVLDNTLTTDENGRAISPDAYLNGEFVIKNIATASSYILTDDVTVSAVDGVWTQETANGPVILDREWDGNLNKWVVTIDIANIQNQVTIHSVSNGTNLTDVEYTIYDEDRNVVFSGSDANAVVYSGLAAGTYYIAQSPITGYITPAEQTLIVDNVTPEYTVTFNNEQTLVTIKTLDGIGGWELNGVEVEMRQGEDVIATFNDANKSQVGIPAGIYTLVTTHMPEGYQAPSTDIVIEVKDVSAEQIFINNVVAPNADPDDEETVVYEDNRTYGSFNILKLDSVTKTPLANVEFSFRYAEDIVIDGVEIMAGAEIARLTTDVNGKASLEKSVPIAIYSANGMQPIVYTLVETTLPVGQYVQGAASIDLDRIVFEYQDDTTPVVALPEIQINNDRPNITVTATSDPETRLYDENGVVVGNEYLTVVENGQEITFTIEVANDGTATGYDIDVRDILPGEFVVTNVDTGSFTIHNGNAYWHIPEIPAGETVKLVLKAKVNVDGAALIDNKVEWTMPETPYGAGEGLDKDDETVEWTSLPTFQYHVVVFASSASKDTLIVSAFDTIQLHYHFTAIDELTDFRMTDVIPEGLTYVEGSALLNGQPYEDVVYDEETRTIEFLSPEEWSNDMTFTFTVKVDYIQNGDEHEWQTDAKATFLANAYTMTEMVVATKKVTILADSIMNVEFDTDIETFIGDPDKADGLTVLQKGDNVCYTVYIYNDGISKLKNVMIKDVLPNNMQIVNITTDMEGLWYYAKAQDVVWFLASIAPGDVVELDVVATVKEQVAGTLANSVRSDVMHTIPVTNADGSITIPEFKNTSRTTDTAIYQVLEFHKSAEVNGKPSNNENVAIGDVLVYTMNITAADLVRGVKVIDKLPAGVSFVPGSAQIKLANDTDWTEMPDALVFDKTTNTVKFAANADAATLLDADAGSNYFRFSVTVDRIGTNNANANNYNKATFTNTATLEYRAIVDDDDSVKKLTSESVTHMTEISVTGGKSGAVDTYEGEYADRKYVTVVSNGDELKFEISIKNAGANALTDVVVQDVVPANTVLVTKDGDSYTNKDGVLTWVIPEIKADETATVSFTVQVAAPADKPVEIINKAKYAVPADINNIKASEWIETNSVVYQAILIKMSSSVAGGTDATDAKTVEIGSTITYTITVENLDDIYGLNLSNKIPDGMEFVTDSAKVKIGDGEATAAKFTLDGNLIKFAQFDEVKAGKMEVSFTVKVKDTTEYDKAVVFINQADVTLKPTKDAEKDLVLKTNPISHTTKKTNATDTPKLGLETTNASLVWALITIIALAGVGVFGYFGFIEPNKKRRK